MVFSFFCFLFFLDDSVLLTIECECNSQCNKYVAYFSNETARYDNIYMS